MVDYKEINLERIDIIKGKPYYNHRAFEFWTPAMYVPFGIDHYDNQWGVKYDMKLAFRNEQGQFLSKFMNKIKALDVYFSKFHSGSQYNSILKNGMYLNVKLPYVNGKFQCGVKHDAEPLPTVFSIKKGCWVRCLLRVDRLWKYNGKSGCVIVAKEIIILKSDEPATQTCMLSNDSVS